MAEIISASEAARLSNKTNSNDIQQELITVENMIKSAVENGEFEIWVATNKFCKKTYEQLEKANYKVQCGFGGNRKTRISWGHLLNDANTRIETISDKVLEFCDQCGAEVEIDPNDSREGWLGAYYFTCPVCGSESMDCAIETDLPTKDSIEFPKHFSKSSVDNGAVDISDEEVQKVIRELSNKLWDETNERDYVSTGYGNMAVFVENYAGEGEYKITVCKDYWEGSIKANPADDYYGGD